MERWIDHAFHLFYRLYNELHKYETWIDKKLREDFSDLFRMLQANLDTADSMVVLIFLCAPSYSNMC